MVDTRQQFSQLASIYLPIGLAVFVLVCGSVGFCLIRSRRGRNQQASQRSHAPLLEGAYALVLVCVASFLVFKTFTTESRVDAVTPGNISASSAAQLPPFQVNVTGSKWKWTFDYPAQRISEVGTLVVPTNTTVRFNVTSIDVIHSFWIPQQRTKRDAFPNHVNSFDQSFNRPGLMLGECSEYCGVGHSNMRFSVRAMTPLDFNRWVSSHRPGTGP
jgi:cytochrome c oxidase subunit II